MTVFILGRARVVVVLFGLGRTFARLVVGLGRVGLLFGLVSGVSRSAGFTGDFSFLFPVSCVDSLDKYLESCESG